jgi:hypothetical protein
MRRRAVRADKPVRTTVGMMEMGGHQAEMYAKQRDLHFDYVRTCRVRSIHTLQQQS